MAGMQPLLLRSDFDCNKMMLCDLRVRLCNLPEVGEKEKLFRFVAPNSRKQINLPDEDNLLVSSAFFKDESAYFVVMEQVYD
jgi:hypothetical protein